MNRDPGKTQGKAQAKTQGGQDARDRSALDSCYGRIGISAVAAALTPRHDERRPDKDRRFTPYESD
ncbi:MAG TPA: hypothetical protein VN655_10205 [Pseudolabrys sp.]|nr:hypothetical protein [Pseudolabrys sp.]